MITIPKNYFMIKSGETRKGDLIYDVINNKFENLKSTAYPAELYVYVVRKIPETYEIVSEGMTKTGDLWYNEKEFVPVVVGAVYRVVIRKSNNKIFVE